MAALVQTETDNMNLRTDENHASAETADFIRALCDQDLEKLKQMAYRVPLNTRFISCFDEHLENSRVSYTPLEFILNMNYAEYVSFYDETGNIRGENDLKILDILVEAGADVNLLNESGLSPVASVIEFGLFSEEQYKIAKALLEHTAALFAERLNARPT
jgi:hypothetical protein